MIYNTFLYIGINSMCLLAKKRSLGNPRDLISCYMVVTHFSASTTALELGMVASVSASAR